MNLLLDPQWELWKEVVGVVRGRIAYGRGGGLLREDKGRREDEGRGMVPVSCMFAVIIFFWFFGCKNLVWFIYSTLDRV